MATSTTTRSRSSTAKRTPRKRANNSTTSRTQRAQSPTDDTKATVKTVRTRAPRAAKKVPADTTALSIAAGVLAGLVAAGIAIFLNRDKLRDAASTGGEKLKKAADDLSSRAHERIDQARDNITKFRARANGIASETAHRHAAERMAIPG